MATKSINHPTLPMDMTKLVILGIVSVLNLFAPLLQIGADAIITDLVTGLNVALGVVGIAVLYLLRNNIRYHITFSNMKETPRTTPGRIQPSDEDEGKPDPESRPDQRTNIEVD